MPSYTPGARMNSPLARCASSAAALSLPAMIQSLRRSRPMILRPTVRNIVRAEGHAVSRAEAAPQTETGFSSSELADLQKVVVSVVVCPFLVAVSSIGRQVLPSARRVAGATGLAATTVGGG